jgi:sterol desaturase/sphingolipid hydroxylase (fatty acid hydroxylase superfamily)
MTETVLANEPVFRLGCFSVVLAAMVLWEFAGPRRPLGFGRARRWTGNLGIAAFNTVLVRLLFPTAAIGAAAYGAAEGWGIFHLVALPAWLSLALAVILLDLVIYFQHRLFHAAPALWLLHRMHHADLDFDTTTGIRFHPVEILLSLGIKVIAVWVLGAGPAAVIVFEVILNGTALFNHGNVRMPASLDRILRLFVVTPDMHRVHHSIVRAETDSNFGFNLPWWDRLFGTYRAQPAAGHDAMTIGIPEFRNADELRLDRMLWQPMRDGEGE